MGRSPFAARRAAQVIRYGTSLGSRPARKSSSMERPRLLRGLRLRRVADAEDAAVLDVEAALLLAVEGAGADAAEDGELVAALVDGAVAVERLADRERGRVR